MGLLTWLGLRRDNVWERPTLLDEFLSSPLQAIMRRVYRTMLFLRGAPFELRPAQTPIRVVCISDTHGQPVAVPDGDLLIHAGDLTDDGTRDSIQEQIDWLASLPHRHKVFVSGNHDSWFDLDARMPEDRHTREPVEMGSVHHLQHSSVTLQFGGSRSLNIYGAPDIPRIGGPPHAFEYDRESPHWDMRIPRETDILVTHTPPAHHRDIGMGCANLLAELWRVRPRLHVFGHTHWAHGEEAAFYDECQWAYERLMSRPTWGPLGDLIPSRSWLDAFDVIYYGIKSILWKYLMRGAGPYDAGLMVNAAQMYGNTGRMGNKPQLVLL